MERGFRGEVCRNIAIALCPYVPVRSGGVVKQKGDPEVAQNRHTDGVCGAYFCRKASLIIASSKKPPLVPSVA